MNPLLVISIVFGTVFGVGVLAMRLRFLLPEHHLNADTKDTVKLAMGLVATMTALILGLIVASAKGSFDTQKSDVITLAAKFVMLDRMLAHYGPESAASRELVRESAQHMRSRLWPTVDSEPVQLDPSTSPGDALYDSIQAMSATNETQAAFKNQAMELALQLGELRWLLYEQAGRSISIPLLIVLTCWLAILFFSFGLFAPPNNTALAALMVSALSASGAIFLILELDQPFDGIIRISSGPIQTAIMHLGK